MWNVIKQFMAAPVFSHDEDKTRSAALLNPLLIGLFVVDVIAALATVFVFAQKLGSGVAVLAVLAICVTAKVLMQRGRVRLAGLLFVVGVWLPVCAIFVLSDQRSMSVVAMVSTTVIAGLILGRQAAVIVAALSSLAPLAATVAAMLGSPLPNIFPSPQLAGWVMLTIGLTMVVLPLNMALRSLGDALLRAQAYAAELEEQRKNLESLVAERTAELTRRTGYLGATTAIAAQMAAAQEDIQNLLDRVVDVIGRQFGFYHVGLFLLDDAHEWALLQATSSEGGRRMLERKHRLRVAAIGGGTGTRPEGIVGDVAGRGQSRVVQDVGVDRVFFNNPDLPGTRSEAALPLSVRGQVIGVLDVQSLEPQAFSDEDVQVLQALADQVAVAINNAELFHQAQASVEGERRALGERARQAWQELLQARPDLAFVSDEQGIAYFNSWEPPMKQAVLSGQTVLGQDDGAARVLAIPIKVRDQVVGVVDGRKPDGAAWTVEEMSLLQALTDQLSTALEGAQLYDATQRRAAREQLTRQITDRMRATLAWDELMQVAVNEMANVLGASRAFVQWVSDDRSILLTGASDGEEGRPR